VLRFCVTFMPRPAVFITSLRDLSYVSRMGFRTRTGEHQQATSVQSLPQSYECERMSYWRWLLFAAMARLELREDLRLRIPDAKTTRHDVTVDVYPDGTLDKAPGEPPHCR
jgi:hypothetical protein